MGGSLTQSGNSQQSLFSPPVVVERSPQEEKNYLISSFLIVELHNSTPCG